MVRSAGCWMRAAAAAVVLMGLAVASARADAIYSVTNLGASPAGRMGGGGYLPGDIFTQNRLSFAADGRVTAGPWAMPGPYDGPVPDAIAQAPAGANAVVLSRAGDNAAGWGYGAGMSWQGFAVIGGTAFAIGGPPGASFSQAYGVNRAGEVVGMSGGAFVYSRDRGLVHVGPGGKGLAAYAINDSGLIVGESLASDGITGRAFLSDDGRASVDLNTLIAPSAGWTLVNATAIDDAGRIAAFGRDSSGAYAALLLTPAPGVDLAQIRAAINGTTPPPVGPPPGDTANIPEPGPLALFGLAAVAGVARRLRRRAAIGG